MHLRRPSSSAAGRFRQRPRGDAQLNATTCGLRAGALVAAAPLRACGAPRRASSRGSGTRSAGPGTDAAIGASSHGDGSRVPTHVLAERPAAGVGEVQPVVRTRQRDVQQPAFLGARGIGVGVRDRHETVFEPGHAHERPLEALRVWNVSKRDAVGSCPPGARRGVGQLGPGEERGERAAARAVAAEVVATEPGEHRRRAALFSSLGTSSSAHTSRSARWSASGWFGAACSAFCSRSSSTWTSGRSRKRPRPARRRTALWRLRMRVRTAPTGRSCGRAPPCRATTHRVDARREGPGRHPGPRRVRRRARPGAAPVVGPHRSGAVVTPEDRRRRPHHLRRRPIVEVELEVLAAGEVPVEVLEEARVGAREAVDRLGHVADDAEVVAFAQPRRDETDREPARILELVDEQVPEPPALGGGEHLVGLDRMCGPPEQVVEVEHPAAPLLPLVAVVEVGQFVADRGSRRCDAVAAAA